jgi:hypothetical protein
MKIPHNLLSGLAFLVPLVIYISSVYIPFWHLPEPVAHFVLTLTAVTGVHLLDRWFLFRETSAELERITGKIEKNVNEQTTRLRDSSSTLQAMNSVGLEKIYAQRKDAAVEIASEIKSSDTKEIRLVGISLNDFVRGDDINLMSAWTHIKSLIEDDRPIDIKFMLIDPYCYGAALRSRGESQLNPSAEMRLKGDVIAMANELMELEIVADTKSNASFKCRFYHTSPILFLCHTDTTSFVQQYYFWNDRSLSPSMPILKYRQLGSNSSIHEGLRKHFDWIWDWGSNTVESVLRHRFLGVDTGVRKSNVVNILGNSNHARERMSSVLENANKYVWIQGNSLHSFFSKVGELSSIMAKVINDPNVEVKVLLIDEDGDQAIWRSYREKRLIDSELIFEEYSSSDLKESHLVVDTNETVQRMKELVSISSSEGQNPTLQARSYKTAPACFLLWVDDSIFVEQYHFGHRQDSVSRILGNDMPLVEFARNVVSLVDEESGDVGPSFDLLVDHFDFVFEQASPINLDGSDDV